MTYRFKDDYSEGAHPALLQALTETNLQQVPGYGLDPFTNEAIELIRKAIEHPAADIHLVSGGTQANLITLASMLQSYESIIAPTTGHIAVHEAGAIEATGHRINTVDCPDGKLTPNQITDVVAQHDNEHMVKPRVVFVSQPTELGTLYSKSELENISRTCKDLDLLLYVDGARLGSALTAENNDVTLPDIARLADAFYIGGTKNGALFGEVVVLTHPDLKTHFRHRLKQRGALLAKGRVLGIQFRELFRDDLYLTLGQHANDRADELRQGIATLGFTLLTLSSTNQLFPIFPNALVEQLQTQFEFYEWQKVDDEQTCIRLVTSWATTTEHTQAFLQALKELTEN